MPISSLATSCRGLKAIILSFRLLVPHVDGDPIRVVITWMFLIANLNNCCLFTLSIHSFLCATLNSLPRDGNGAVWVGFRPAPPR